MAEAQGLTSYHCNLVPITGRTRGIPFRLRLDEEDKEKVIAKLAHLYPAEDFVVLSVRKGRALDK